MSKVCRPWQWVGTAVACCSMGCASQWHGSQTWWSCATAVSALHTDLQVGWECRVLPLALLACVPTCTNRQSLLPDPSCGGASALICSTAGGGPAALHPGSLKGKLECFSVSACMHQPSRVLPHQSLHHCCQPGSQLQYVSSALRASVWQLCWTELVSWKGWGPSLCPLEANAYRTGDALTLQPESAELAKPSVEKFALLIQGMQERNMQRILDAGVI